jgi:hypothetical protein
MKDNEKLSLKHVNYYHYQHQQKQKINRLAIQLSIAKEYFFIPKLTYQINIKLKSNSFW